MAKLAASKSAPKAARRPDARPDEILDAALAEFAARGFDAARMEDVAKRAGLSKAGVYLYFPSKEALLTALIEREMAPIATRVAALAAAGQADPVAAMRLIAATFAERFTDTRIVQIPRLVISIANRFPEITDLYRARVAEPGIKAFESLVRAGIAQGVFRDMPERAAMRAFIGPLLFEAAYGLILKGEGLPAREDFIAQHFDMFLNGLLKRSSP